MAGKNKQLVNIPEEYKNREYPYEQWIKDVVASAVQKQSTRNGGVFAPSWWDDVKNGRFENCIGTATDSYGVSPAYGNQSFLNKDSNEYYEKKGFRLLGNDEEGQDGDLYQEWVNDKPFHMVMRTGKNFADEPLISYGTGSLDREYDGQDMVKVSPMKQSVPLYQGNWNNRFRFVGTPEQRSWLDARNAQIKANTPTTQKVQPQPMQVNQPSAQQALQGASATLQNILNRQKERRAT